jgi:inhibitor of KinA
MQITALGDSALIVRVCDRFEDAPEETLSEVLAALRRLENAHFPGVIELATAYTTVAIFFDPLRVINDGAEPDGVIELLIQRIGEALAAGPKRHKRAAAHTAEIPVCYDLEFAIDLERVASHAQISPSEVVDLHGAAEYRVNCIGFTPGFPYLTGLPNRIATPRHTVPRKEIPAGSVAIGGAQAGIYPQESPGGWNVIGRTPLRLFDPQRDPPVLLQPGDQVRFRKITREEFQALQP